MKRLFVPDRFKGHGIGRRLCRALMISARDEGYAWMRLDTATLLTEAIGMYKSLGFRECPPHRAYPDELMSYLIFMEISLARPWAEPRTRSPATIDPPTISAMTRSLIESAVGAYCAAASISSFHHSPPNAVSRFNTVVVPTE